MIDIENQTFTIVRDRANAKLPFTVDFSSEYVDTPTKFPHTSLYVADIIANTKYEDSSRVENVSDVFFEVDHYSNKQSTRKSECKMIAKAVDEVMEELGFRRVMMNPIPNIADSTVYRIKARYAGTVDRNNYIYRR